MSRPTQSVPNTCESSGGWWSAGGAQVDGVPSFRCELGRERAGAEDDDEHDERRESERLAREAPQRERTETAPAADHRTRARGSSQATAHSASTPETTTSAAATVSNVSTAYASR